MSQSIQSKRGRLFKNSIYGVFSWLFPILPAFIVTPILIGRLGNEIYGIYVVILGFVSYFFVLNLGKAATKYVAEYRATGDAEKISETVSATLLISFGVGLITTGSVAILARPFVSELLRIQIELQETAVIALYLACANIFVLVLTLTFQFILQGLQRFDRFLLVTNLSSVFMNGGIIALAYSGFGIIALLALSLAVSVVSGVVSLIFVKRLLPEIQFKSRISGEVWKDVTRYSLSIMAYQLFGSLLLLFERAWITRQFGPAELTFYVVPMTLALYVQAFVASLVLALFPAINENLSRADVLVELYKKSTKVVTMFVAFAFVTVLVAGKLFLSLWLGQEFADRSYQLLIIHVATTSIVALAMIVWQVAESFRSTHLTAGVNFLWMAIGIPSMILLSYPWQTFGVAYGRLLGVIVYVPFILYVERRLLGGIFGNFWLAIGSRVAVAAALAFVMEYIILSQLSPSWIALALSLVSGVAVYGAALLMLGFLAPDERLMFKAALLPDR